MKFSFDKENVALVVVDMQRLFTDPTSPYGNDASDMIAPINLLSVSARNLNIPVIHSSYQLKKDGSDIGLRSDWPQVAQGYFDPESEWSKWDPRIKQDQEDHVLTRNRPGLFFDGKLTSILKKLGKEQIILCGLSINYAISFSIHEAFSLDIPVFLVDELSNLTAFEDSSKKDFLHKTLDMWACELISLENISQKLTSLQPAQSLS